MLNQFWKVALSVAAVILGMNSRMVSQELSGTVQFKSSQLSMRKIGEASLANLPSAKAQASAIRGLTTSGEQSPLVAMHTLAHHWGRVLAEKRLGADAFKLASLPAVTPLPVIAPDAGFRGFVGLTAAEQTSVSGYSAEPPDQGLCTDGNVVLEAVNLAMSAYDAKTHRVLAGPVFLNDFFFADPTDFTSDPMCYYDPATERWFVTLTDLGGPTTELLLAVSKSSDPTADYNVYFIDTVNDGFFDVCPCFGDQPLIGADNNGFYISTNAIGAYGFGGVQIYAMSKFELELGIVPFGVHITPLSTGGGLPYPYSLQPSVSPDGNGAPENGGTEYFVSTYDITALQNNKVSVWAMTDTVTLDGEAGLPGFTSVAVGTEGFALPIPASQKAGPIPLGRSMKQPEGMLDPDDERMQQVIYQRGNLWAAVGTSLNVGANTLDGVAYFVIQPSWHKGVLKASVAKQGYVATANENLLYPAVAVTENGDGAIVFTLTGPDYFPSAAYIPITFANGVAADGVRLAAAGVKPDDGITEYLPQDDHVGRWGDYSAAVAVGTNSIWIATEYIPRKPRDHYSNWGTFVGFLPVD